MSIENDILLLTAAVQDLTAALSTPTAALTGVDTLAAQQQAQLDVAVPQPVAVQQPVQQVQQPVTAAAAVNAVNAGSVPQPPVAPLPGIDPALTQEAVVAELVSAMNRLGPGGQERIIAELSQAFGSHKVPEIPQQNWPGVVQYVRQMV